MGQLSFWSADARPRALGDLEGLLCGPGRAELFGRGSLARLIVVLGPPPVVEDEDDQPDEADEHAESLSPDAADDPTPDVDLDDLAFLDLDPDELAARLGQAPADPEPEPRESGNPGDECQRGRRACTDVPDPMLRWRARAVCCALGVRGVPAEVGWTDDGRPEVRTAFRADLVHLARAWLDDAGMKTVPAEFELDGSRLRLWVLASGAHEGRAYTLGLDHDAREPDKDLLTASRHLGLGASLAGDGHPPALRVVGVRRQRRLGELVGRPPGDLADGVWPV